MFTDYRFYTAKIQFKYYNANKNTDMRLQFPTEHKPH